jgi:predicted Zn finger-like uncharacterized protein
MILTRCPHCDTVFRITAEQLKARAGKVRCGSCSTVFNALAALIDAPLGQVLSVPESAAQPAPDGPAQVPSASAPAAGHEAPLPRSDAPGRAQPDAAEPLTLHLSGPADEITIEPLEDFAPDPAPDAAPAAPEPRTAATAAAAPEARRIAADDPDDPGDEGARGSALEEVLAGSGPRRARAGPWAGGIALLGLALGVQAAYVFRDEIAVAYPATKPALQGLCGALGCELSLPRKVELLGIETSDLHPDPAQPGLLTLVATIKNRAPFAQRHPHLELTLTDNLDKPIARRALAPADYLPRGAAEAFAPGAELALNLHVEAREVAASGYRLYLFYP